MDVSSLLTEIDAEINRLQQARAALAGIQGYAAKRISGRPKHATTKSTAVKKATKKRTLSPEARARISAAQKRRWAETKKKSK